MPRLCLLAACTLLSATANAQSFSYSNFSSTVGLRLLGDAVQSNGAVRLTNSVGQGGWLWHLTPQPIINGFDTTFTFRITPPPLTAPGMGMAFVIHNAASGPFTTAGHGKGMGYGGGDPSVSGIPNSIAIELDTVQEWFHGDTSNNELSIHTAGASENNEDEAWSIGRTTPQDIFANGQVHTVRIHYVPGVLRVYLNDMINPALSVPYDYEHGGTHTNNMPVGGIGSPTGKATIGFCATTGPTFLKQTVEILTWDWDPVSLAGECGDGTLGADTLTVNGVAGAALRRVDVALGAPFTIDIANPPGFGAGAPYLLFASIASQPGAPGTDLGLAALAFQCCRWAQQRSCSRTRSALASGRYLLC